MLIDSSTNIEGCLKRHKAALKLGTHRNCNLQTDWNLRVASDFCFDIVEIITPENSIDKGLRVTLKERTEAFKKKFADNLY